MALTTEKKIYVALGVLALMAGGLYMQQRSVAEEMAKHAPGAIAASLPEIKISAEDAEKVTKLEIRNADKGEVVLEKQGDIWMMTKPVSYPAHFQNVKSLIDNLQQLKLKDTIDPGDSQYATYDLEDGKAVRITAYKGDEKAVDLYFGKSGSRGQMARLADQPGVYIASGYASYLYARETKNWRDAKILEFDDSKVVSIELTNENGKFSFSKSGDTWSGTLKGQKLALDADRVKDLLRAYKGLSAEDFADDKSEAETGLDKPAVTLTFKLDGDGGTRTVLVGSTISEESKSRYAKTPDKATTFVIGSWVAEWATAGKGKFEKSS